ncbi:transposase [Streptomyces cacaoi]|uniref:transposase n=1 Tax=Streptomyces cacaoi TaxID=1898 RepID=UPI003748A5C5
MWAHCPSPPRRPAGSAARRRPTQLSADRAATLGRIGDIGRFPTGRHFAGYVGSAPLDASRGENVRHRLNIGGNRPRTAPFASSRLVRAVTAVGVRSTTCSRSPKGKRTPKPVGRSSVACPTSSVGS